MKGSDVLYSRYNQATEMLRYRRYAIAAFLLLIFIIGFTFYNTIASSSANVDSQWSNLKGQLSDRKNMALKLSMILDKAHFDNKQIIQELNDSADNFTKAEKLKEIRNANFRIENAINHVMDVANDYTSLRENADFINLQKELKEKEEDITYAQKEFNASVQSHNMKVKFLPYSLVAEQLGMKEKEYFRPYEKSRHISDKVYGKEKPELYMGEEPKEKKDDWSL